MSSDAKIPEWAEKVAQDFHDKWDTGMSGAAFRDLVRALLAAEQRGRKAGIEEAYSAVRASRDMDGSTSDDWDQGHACAYGDALAAIRSLGEKT